MVLTLEYDKQNRTIIPYLDGKRLYGIQRISGMAVMDDKSARRVNDYTVEIIGEFEVRDNEIWQVKH